MAVRDLDPHLLTPPSSHDMSLPAAKRQRRDSAHTLSWEEMQTMRPPLSSSGVELVADHSAATSPETPAGKDLGATFRNVSACHRCRTRKNKCDQQLPSCRSCEKVGLKCVGYDPITKQEIPRR